MTRTIALNARGKIVEVNGRVVEFHPTGTSYRLHLEAATDAPPTVSPRPVEALIRVRARKIWTVPSGGLFIAPIVGTPRTIQGRVRHLDQRQMQINAGTMIVVDLPTQDAAYDLTSGPIELGTIVNVVAFPGATIELVHASGAGARVSSTVSST